MSTFAEKPIELDLRAWAKVRRIMLTTGQFDPNLSDEMSPEQRYWVNQTKLALRDLEEE